MSAESVDSGGWDSVRVSFRTLRRFLRSLPNPVTEIPIPAGYVLIRSVTPGHALGQVFFPNPPADSGDVFVHPYTLKEVGIAFDVGPYELESYLKRSDLAH